MGRKKVSEKTKQERGERLKITLKKKNITQTKFAEICGFENRESIANRCAGATLITEEDAEIFSRELGVSKEYLLCKTEEENETTFTNYVRNKGNSVKALAILELFRQHGKEVSFYVVPADKKAVPLVPFSEYRVKDTEEISNYTQFPLTLEEHLKCQKEYRENPKEEIFYKNWNDVREKASLEELQGLSFAGNACLLCKGETQKEVFIECVEIEGSIINYKDFVALVNIGLNSFFSIMDSSSSLSLGNSFHTNSDYYKTLEVITKKK